MDFVARRSPESNGGAMAGVPKGGTLGGAPAATDSTALIQELLVLL